ncbi:hypothetical protein VXS06_06545 [Photobacterium toruni]|uniref:Uncharacterized protein n=1 Tax=Photobacterium toruni TaxID=1935446 RepID=A0A1T4T143_9GAMM|nr:hypothetical protein [Photobacterium toruni]MEC6831427.1 hypothetical protein [Photobacterium toruni]SKA34122.1 hypothetical protein CZ814_01885 [Photobacterium toruni]
MIRENVFTPFATWSKPLVSEVAEAINLLKDNGYDAKQLTLATGLQEKNICNWTAKYKKEPLDVSSIPYPCWCFIAALIGRPNIATNGKVIEVEEIKRVLRLFKPSAFGSQNTFICPTSEQFAKLIDSGLFAEMTTENIAALFNWKPENVTDSLRAGKLPYLNWCLIIMMFGINIQKMALKDLDTEITINQ